MASDWTIENIPDLSGKTAIVTGANSGIGYETARALAGKGAAVALACRNLEKGAAALKAICGEFPQAKVELMQLDLASLASVRSFAAEAAGRYERLDMLINNAGVMAPPFGKTADGFETQFGANHLGHFALTGLLLDLIKRTPQARVVNVSSGAHRFGKIDFENLNGEKGYSAGRFYGQSKLANLLFTYELERRFEQAHIAAIAAAAHPGWTATNLQAEMPIARWLNPLLGQPTLMGALPTLYAAAAAGVQGGDYYGPNGWQEMRGYPVKVTSNERSYDTAVAAKLWAVSEQMTGVVYQF